MSIELVKTEAADGVALDGALRVPDAQSKPGLPVDAVIMHHGVGGNFYRTHFYDAVGEKLLARGCAVLRVNNRGHDLAYNAPPPHKRLGAAFETVDDCRLDWRAWIDVMEARGYVNICVWGHSLGAVKTIYYLANEQDARVVRAVASSPPRFSYDAYLAHPDGQLFADTLAEAQALRDAGREGTLFPIEVPTAALMTPGTFFDKYGPDARYDILAHLPKIATPMLVTIGGLEGRDGQADRFAFGGLGDKVAKIAAANGALRYRLVDGADHFYTGVTDDLWRAVEGWLAG